jgi:hypothetical protein
MENKRDLCLEEAEKVQKHYRGFRRNLNIIRELGEEKGGEKRDTCILAADKGDKDIWIEKNIYRLWMALADSYQHLSIQNELW